MNTVPQNTNDLITPAAAAVLEDADPGHGRAALEAALRSMTLAEVAAVLVTAIARGHEGDLAMRLLDEARIMTEVATALSGGLTPSDEETQALAELAAAKVAAARAFQGAAFHASRRAAE